MKKKYSITLIEVVIALSILSVLIFTLFSLYRNLSKGEEKLTRSMMKVYEKHQCYAVLQRIFSQLQLEEETFYTEADPVKRENALVLKWNNAVQMNPELSGPIEGKIYSKEGTLYLQYLKKNKVLDEMPLFENVESMNFQFYNVELNEWMKNWDKQAKSFPAIVKIDFKTKEKKSLPFEMVFFIHTSDNLIRQES